MLPHVEKFTPIPKNIRKRIIQVFANVFRNEALSVLGFTQRRLQNDMKESANTAHNEFEPTSVGFGLSQFSKRSTVVNADKNNLPPPLCSNSSDLCRFLLLGSLVFFPLRFKHLNFYLESEVF